MTRTARTTTTRSRTATTRRNRAGRGRTAAGLAALCLAGALALTGCGAASDSGARKSAEAVADSREDAARQGPEAGKPGAGGTGATAVSSAAPEGGGQSAALRTHVIRTATLGIETADVQKSLAGARTAVEGAGGYVSGESTHRDGDGRVTSTVTLRVPGERFDSVLGALEGGGKLLNRKVDAQDVTEKVTDVDSRVRSQQASVARVREMMGKASALSDVVMLEGELSKRQSDLESLLAQQSGLKDRTSMGTVTLEVSEPGAREEKDEPAFADALEGGWRVFATLVRYLVLAVAAVLPFALTAGLVMAGFRVHRKLRPARPRTGLAPKRVPARQPWPAPAPAGPAATTTPGAAPAPTPAEEAPDADPGH
ncbi:DUF4349 domain-containing protein [Streptomyces sp. NPDC051567]|uniref:DUF4349 domain-containing protein n=1 Tax=Streptomyces sp. NPDC051567 TaxID=3365660 RepID=UPI0037B2F5D8